LNRISYILLFLIAFSGDAFGQKTAHAWINNTDLKYSFMELSLDADESQVIVVLSDIDKVGQLKDLTVEEWTGLLASDDTDWAALVVLHSLFSRDGSGLRNSNAVSWRNKSKSTDVLFWSNHLTDHFDELQARF